MNTNERQLLEMIRQGEGIATEFKACRKGLSRDVYETVCAFLNRHGGTILLGVMDSGDIQGIEHDAVEQIKKDFITTINNPQKIYPPAYLSVDEVKIMGKPVLRVYVPESSQVHRCNGKWGTSMKLFLNLDRKQVDINLKFFDEKCCFI